MSYANPDVLKLLQNLCGRNTCMSTRRQYSCKN